MSAAPGYEFHYDWFSGNIPVWQEHLGWLAGRRDLVCIEIGSWEGRSAVWLLENVVTHESSTLHCLAPWTASPNGKTIAPSCTASRTITASCSSSSRSSWKKCPAESGPETGDP